MTESRGRADAKQTPKSNRAIILLVLGAVAAALGVIFIAKRFLPESGGSTRDEFVLQTRSVLGTAASPEEAEALIPGGGTVHFPNGEWVAGIGIDSHSWKRARDTLVVRDSRGQVRAFVGHVCGPQWMPRYFPENHRSFQSLNDFYAFLKEWGFSEYTPPAQ